MKTQKTIAFFLLFIMVATIVFAAWTPPSFPIDLRYAGAIINATDVNSTRMNTDYINATKVNTTRIESKDWTNFTNLGNILYLGISATAANSQLLDSIDSSGFLNNDTNAIALIVTVNNTLKANDSIIYTMLVGVNSTGNIINLGFVQVGTTKAWLSDAANITTGSLNDTQVDNNITINTTSFVESDAFFVNNGTTSARWNISVNGSNWFSIRRG